MNRWLVSAPLALLASISLFWLGMADPAARGRERLPAADAGATADTGAVRWAPAALDEGPRSPAPAEELPRAAAPEDLRGFAVVALGADGARLTARVMVEDGHGPRALGLTTPERLVDVDPATAVFPMRLIASTETEPRRVGQLVLSAPPALAVAAIVLADDCALRGTVVDPWGGRLPAGIRVVALDPYRRLRWLEERSAGGEPLLDGGWAETVTDQDGRFVLTGLLAGRGYCLTAAGLGFVTSERDAQARHACGGEVVLALQPLFGGIARLGTQRTDDLARAASKVVFGPVRLAAWPKGSFPRDIATEPALIGSMLEQQARQATDEGSRVIVFTSAEDVPELRMTAQVRIPFLPEASYAIAVPRLVDALAEIPIDVPEPEDVLGTLDVVALTTPGGLELLAPDSEVASLKLTRAGTTTEVIVRAEALLAGFSVPGLPVGTYEWKLTYPGAGRLLPRKGEPPGLLALAAGGGSLLLDLTWAAGADLIIRDAEGIPFSGPIQATFGAPNGIEFQNEQGQRVVGFDDAAVLSWREPPYVAPLLPPGDYQVACSADFGRHMRSGYSELYPFQMGRVTRVELQGK